MAATMLFPNGLACDTSGDSQLVATHGDLIVYRGDYDYDYDYDYV